MPKAVKPSESQQESLEYEVEEVIGERMTKSGRQYYVLWKGYSVSEGSWEPEKSLLRSKEKIRQFKLSTKNALIKKKFYSKQNKKQKKLYKDEKIQNIADLRQIVSKKGSSENNRKNKLVDDDKITGFEKLFPKPADQWLKIKRFDRVEQQHIQKIQQCGEIIAKAATMEKRKTNFPSGLIDIISVTEISGEKVVRFQKNKHKYQCRLQLLRTVCPIDIIDYLLKCYNPAENKLEKETINLEADIQKQN